jgi:hypothetical protein
VSLRDDLGFDGLLQAGYTPEEAWAEIRADCHDPSVRSIFAGLEATEEGRAALEWSRQQWAARGLSAPWEDS